MKKTEITIGVHYLIRIGGLRRVGWRAKVVREGVTPNRRRWKPDTVGWWVQRVDEKSGRKKVPEVDRAFYSAGYDAETGLTFVTSRMIVKTWAQHLDDEKATERHRKRALKLRDERVAVQIARVERFADFGIEVKLRNGGIYLEADEADLLLDRFARLTGTT